MVRPIVPMVMMKTHRYVQQVRSSSSTAQLPDSHHHLSLLIHYSSHFGKGPVFVFVVLFVKFVFDSLHKHNGWHFYDYTDWPPPPYRIYHCGSSHFANLIIRMEMRVMMMALPFPEITPYLDYECFATHNDDFWPFVHFFFIWELSKKATCWRNSQFSSIPIGKSWPQLSGKIIRQKSTWCIGSIRRLTSSGCCLVR